ncbi:MAG TPA: energy transducer TonB [Thermoanaerobaculia bacterium]|jgi:hypothetical protein
MPVAEMTGNMSERKRCIRCERGIDQWATICPFCNWDQKQPVPAAGATQMANPVTTYVPPTELNLKKKALMAGGGVLLLIASFFIGSVINRDDAVEVAPESAVEQSREEAARADKLRRADTPLVPAGEGGMEAPITSAPNAVPTANGPAPDNYDRSDATAVSSVEYQQLAQRAKAEKERMAALVDPRSLSGPAYAQGAPIPRPPVRRTAPPPVRQPAVPSTQPATQPQPPAEAAREQRRDEPRVESRSTGPVPEYQPIPRVASRGRARLDLVVGPDGRVKRIHVRNAVRGTSELISAVQNWRFRPATDNGRPVTGNYSVEISFGGNG